MNFKELVECLAEEVGYHQVPINTNAKHIDTLFDNCALHHELMLRLMRAVYRGNACRKLTDHVNHAATLDAIAPIRLEVIRSTKTDIDTKRFIDDLCSAVVNAFEHNGIQSTAATGLSNKTARKIAGSEILLLDDYRQRLKSSS